MPDLGKLTHLDPREAWKSESANFTPWLEQNLDRLSSVLGRDLEFTQRESPSSGIRARSNSAKNPGRTASNR